MRAFGTGAALPNFGPSHLKQAKIVVRSTEIGRSYEAIVAPYEELVCNLIQTNTILRRTRDLLLPKLISGEIPIEAADDATAELVAQPA